MKTKTYKPILLIIAVFISSNIYGQFITTWDTGNNTVITIPTSGNGYNYDVDWGDGTTDTGVTGNKTHSYTTSGVYTVSITGTFPRIYFANSGINAEKILTIEQWGSNAWESFSGAFSTCKNLTINATDAPDLSNVTSLGNMFKNCWNLEGGVSNWNVSTITNFSEMFRSAQSFNGDLSNWDVSNAIGMDEMFFAASSFNGDLSNWDVSNVTAMEGFFTHATAFNGDLSNWNVSKVTSMFTFFANATAFNGDISNWDVSNVYDMGSMFSGATAFNGDLSNWDVSNVFRMSSMFGSATSFNSDLSNWDVSNVTDMGGMFGGTAAFNGDISNWDVSNVSDMGGMFGSTAAFNSDISNWDVSNVTDMGSMFASAAAFNGDISNWDVSNVSDMGSMFSGAESFNQNLDLWDVSNVTDMEHMFSSTVAFNGDISTWDVSSVSNMGYMFDSAAAFNGDISNWDVSNVIDMTAMFYGAPTFNTDIGSWDVSNVTIMTFMFSSTAAFNRDISTWNVSNVISMYGMFKEASAFDRNLASWNVSSVTSFVDFLSNSGLSSSNYNALLNSWSLLNLQNDIIFDAKNVFFSFGAISARQKIIADNNWTINDGGLKLTTSNTVAIEENIEGEILDLNVDDGTGASTDAGISYSLLASANDNDLFTITSSDGKLAFINSPDFENPTDQNIDNEYEILIAITDNNGLNLSNNQIKVTVTDINEAPTVLTPIEDITILQESELNYAFPTSSFNDVDDGDVLTYSVEQYPVWATLTGTNLTGTPQYEHIGSDTIVFKVTDAAGLFVTDTIMVTVEFTVYDVVVSVTDTTICEGETATLNASGAVDYNWYDAGGNVLQSGGDSYDHIAIVSVEVFVEGLDIEGRPTPTKTTSAITVNPLPIVTITLTEESISVPADESVTYQWYDGGNLIEGATESIFMPLQTGEYLVNVTSDLGCVASSETINITILGLNSDKYLLDIYPNPTYNYLHVSGIGNISDFRYDVIDVNGIVLNVSADFKSDGFTIDTSLLKRGQYVLRIKSQDSIESIRFIKE